MNYINPKIKVSFIIPYKNRLDNIKLLFESLSKQTMDKSEFEVVVGAMEYCREYVSTCHDFKARLNIRTVMTGKDWQIAYARNIALRQAEGNVVVLLDADMILSPGFLINLYEKHYSYNQNQCIIGQMIDYDNNSSEITSVQVKPFSHYEKKLMELENAENTEIDERLKVPCNIPWAFAWTALIALPRRTIEENQLYFDLNFRGYGVEDLEWAYRICRAGIPISLRKDVWGIHLPHIRNINNNRKTEKINYSYFLKKWPGVDVELACAFGDFLANCNYPEFKNEILNITNHKNSSFAILKGLVNGVSTLVVGAIRDEDGSFENASCFPEFDMNTATEILPIVGLSFPYEENDIEMCYILPSIDKFAPKYRDVIKGECERVSKKEVINI